MSRPVTRSKKALGHVIATVRAFGGFTLLLTKSHKVVYASPLAKSLVPLAGDVLAHAELAAVADEAWASREHIARPVHLTTLGPYVDVVIQAAVVEARWVVLSVTDRTDEVRSVQIRRDFVANLGHELRTPVTSLGLIAQALASCAAEPASVEHFAGRLTRLAERLDQLTDEMLALARVEDGTPTRVLTTTTVRTLVDRAVAQALETARSRGVKLKTKLRFDAQLLGDEEALVTALENLLSNAIHYSPKGSRVTIATQAGEAGGTVAIDILDRGIGIAGDEQERVFERFYRADAARSRRSGGTGLGLAIVKHTALAHGGSVGLVSQAGSGSTFTLTLPVLTAPPGEAG
ncbi:MAG: two-component sensor histidine kinase [Propionibacteriaceae bacterium]|jgi:two-component system sensor histidine kinase SenX3|nr:two-component sensor histidine kinase [Propionibacteriaceae bacterium]